MGQPTWREIKKVDVPATPDSLWTPALDFVTPGKLYRILIAPKGEQTSQVEAEAADKKTAAASTGSPTAVKPANGEKVAAPPTPPLQPAQGAPLHDQLWTPESGTACTADGDPTLTRAAALTLPTSAVGALIAKIGGSTADLKPDAAKVALFSVGRHCVFSIADLTKIGGLYLGMNDGAGSQTKVEGKLSVTIFESL